MKRSEVPLVALVLLSALLGPAERTAADERAARHTAVHLRARRIVTADSAVDPASSSARSEPAPKPDVRGEDKNADGGKKGSKKKKSVDPLPGKTIDFTYDAKDIKSPSRAYMGRLFVHDKAAASKKPLPLVVFMHGLNRALIKYRWMGGGEEGDVRRIVSDLIDAGTIPPVLLAGPSSIQPDAVSGSSSFPAFDFDRFMALTRESFAGIAQIDEAHVIVTGHSGAGCSPKGGIVSALRASKPPFAVVSIDTCMGADLAKSLAAADPSTHVIVTYETVSWDRDFATFKKTFDEAVAQQPAAAGVMRELDKLPALPSAHDATVGQTFEKYLPRLLP